MSPRSVKQNEQLREQSRDKILASALELFGTQGFHNTSIEEIARHAGVSKGLTYNYFGSKLELLYGIFNREMNQGDQILERLRQLPDARSRLVAIIESSIQYIRSMPAELRLLTSLSLHVEEFPEIKEALLDRYRTALPLIADILRELGIPEPETEARMFNAMLDGVGFQAMVLKDMVDLDLTRTYLLNRYHCLPDSTQQTSSSHETADVPADVPHPGLHGPAGAGRP
ncbi:MAG: TetR/AcrR family transcriptional regulator [Bacteroidia bacterium]|nr:TetR/AcrR family transcriptional regulator [Bacteroidia bacterium]